MSEEKCPKCEGKMRQTGRCLYCEDKKCGTRIQVGFL